MGNEMGNNNTSGLREEDNRIQDESQQKVAYANDFKGQNHDPEKTDNKEEDDMKTEGKNTLLEASQTDDVKGQSHDDNQKQDEKEEDSNMIPEAKEKPLQEVAKADEANGQDQVVPQAEDENTNGNEPELVSSEPDGIASPHVDGRKQDEKGKDNSTNLEAEEKSLEEATSTDKKDVQADLVLVAGEENSHGIKTGLVSSDPDGTKSFLVNNLNQDVKEEDIKINDKAEEKSSAEAACTDVVERQDHLPPAVEENSSCGNESKLVSDDPEGIADPHVENPKQNEKEEDNVNAEPQEKPKAKDIVYADDIEEKGLTIPGAEDEGCNNIEAEEELASGDSMLTADTLDDQILEGQEQDKIKLQPPAESTEVDIKQSEEVCEGKEIQPASSSKGLENHELKQELNSDNYLCGKGDHFENQNFLMKEDEGTRNSISDAALAASNDSAPQEPVVPEPGQYELAERETEQLVKVCNGLQKSVDMINPTLTCPVKENGFSSDSSISTDPSPEIEKEMDDFSVKEMATKGVCSEEKVEVEVEDGIAIMTDLPNGIGDKCKVELPSEMNFDKGLVYSHKDLLVREELENGDSKQSHCQVQSMEESTEKPNGLGSEDGSKADEANEALPLPLPQLMMNGHCDSESIKDCQLEEAKVVKSEAIEEQQKQVPCLSVPNYKQEEEEELEEKRIMEEMVGIIEGSPNPVVNDRRESREQCISHSTPTQQQEAEAFLSPCLVHALPEAKPLVQQCGTEQCANGDYNQQKSMGRLSNESNPENTTIHAPMRKSPSFDLHLRIDARAEESDQAPLLYQDKATIESLPSQGDDDHVSVGKPVEASKKPLQYEAIPAQEKVVTLERSDSDKSKTPFLSFMKEEEDNHSSSANKASPKGKEKRKPRASLFGTCMCCATVIN